MGVVQFAGVFLEVEIPAKSFATNAARKLLKKNVPFYLLSDSIILEFKLTYRFLVVVRVHVEGEIVDLVEGLVADDALVGLFDAVRQFVVLVVALLVESLAAVLADERLESGVNAHVSVERRRAVERLAASRALVRLLRRVDDLVAAQRRRLPEALAADLADERTGPRVHRHVTRQIVVGVEHFAAVGARENAALVVVVAAAARAVDARPGRRIGR